MMKILHTADWHIGKKLYKHDLSQDFKLFIDWLCQTIKAQQVDLLLVSGDIFDLANPSAEARKQYYQALVALRGCGCKIILTGGNHDSPAVLEAPKDLLRQLNVEVIGGLPENPDDCLIPVHVNGKEELIIAALPYLRDSDLRTAGEGSTHEERLEAVSKGIRRIFAQAASSCQKRHENVPAMAMGHLFAAGASSSDSEREIQIGNLAAFEASGFGSYFKYIALGHIHKPQRIEAPVPVFYSGSPLPLSFSEREDHKRVLLIDTLNWEPVSIPVPSFRKLLRVRGSLDQITVRLPQLEAGEGLEHLVEIELVESEPDPLKIRYLDELVSTFSKPGIRILRHRVEFLNRERAAADLFDPGVKLEDLQPKEVFLRLLEDQDYSDQTLRDLLSAFDEVLEEVQQSESSL